MTVSKINQLTIRDCDLDQVTNAPNPKLGIRTI